MCQLSGLATLYEFAGIDIPGDDLQPENRLLKILVDEMERPASDAPREQMTTYKDLTSYLTGDESNILRYHPKYEKGFNKWDDNSTRDVIDSGRPVTAGSNTTGSGHVLTIIGYDKTGWIINDSYGNKNLDYQKGNTDQYGYNGYNGAGVHYNYGTYKINKTWRAFMKNKNEIKRGN